MLVERKSLKRFLFIYIFSTLFLLSVGGYYYYKTSYQSIINHKLVLIKKDIEKFININRTKKLLKTKETPSFLDFSIAIYIKKQYFKGNTKFKNIDFSKEYYVKNNKLYFIHKEHKPWGNIYLVTFRNIQKDINELIRNMIIFFIFSSLFIIVISFILGKIFIKPLKDTIVSLENFITDATHEINTPISNILMNIEMLNEFHPLLKESEEFKKIKSSSFRISKIFKDLSYISFNHKAKKNISNINLTQFLQQRLEFFKTMIKNKNITIELNLESAYIKIDLEDLTRLIDNLISNAIKYSKPNSTIHIKLTSNFFEIINEGSINDIKNITKKFVRENKNEGGFGIGLHIVEKISNEYNFRFQITSKNQKVLSKILFC